MWFYVIPKATDYHCTLNILPLDINPRGEWRMKSWHHSVYPVLHLGQVWIFLEAWVAFYNLLSTEGAHKG